MVMGGVMVMGGEVMEVVLPIGVVLNGMVLLISILVVLIGVEGGYVNS